MFTNCQHLSNENTLYSVCQIRQIEEQAYQSAETDPHTLMEKAGASAFALLQEHWPNAELVTVCCGQGNNAGDGYVLARLAHEAKLSVTVLTVDGRPPSTDTALAAYEAAVAAGVSIKPFNVTEVIEADVIVDALLGIGLKGGVRPPYVDFINAMNLAPYPVFALDSPSGLLADTGVVAGVAVKAALTLTFIGKKRGFYTAQGPEFCGAIVCHALGLSEKILKASSTAVQLLQDNVLRTCLPKRRRDAHKGDYGHVLVIGGDYGMGGAVRMAAEAALRVGAGLVTVATRPEHVPVVSSSRPELMCQQVVHADDILPLLSMATVIVIGPGLGKTEWAHNLLNHILNSKTPTVLDADALNLLSLHPKQAEHWVLTPHPGEAGRLLGCCSADIQADRFAAATALQAHYGGVIVLKGAGTVIAQAHQPLRVCAAGNPGMATGGMGDILSGVIGGLLAQQMSLGHAAELGVYVHAKAADIAAELGGERGLLATDLLAHLRELVNPDADITH